jgi:hypothetical protein
VTSELCSVEGCGLPYLAGCIHGLWCGECANAHSHDEPQCARDITRSLYLLARRVLIPVLELESEIFPVRCALIDEVRRLYETLSDDYRRVYLADGAPYGMDDGGLWRWVGEQCEGDGMVN